MVPLVGGAFGLDPDHERLGAAASAISLGVTVTPEPSG
jgi:hypothetical protein